MSAPIDIYEYRPDLTAIERLRYIAAVCEAHELGQPVEMVSIEDWAPDEDRWAPMPKPSTEEIIEGFRPNWLAYRIARPKIAEGHNPDKLTEAQVGVQDGWRLLSDAEVAACVKSRDATAGIEYNRHSGCGSGKVYWLSNDTMGFHVVHGAEFRTKAATGHYLPKPAAEPVAEPVAETRPGALPVERPKFWFEPANDPRNETRHDRIATIVKLIRNGSETADQIAARIEAMLNQPAK